MTSSRPGPERPTESTVRRLAPVRRHRRDQPRPGISVEPRPRRIIVPTALFAGCMVFVAGAIFFVIRARKSDRVASDRFAEARFVTEVALRDTKGNLVTPRAWRGMQAVVLFPLGRDREEGRRLVAKVGSALSRRSSNDMVAFAIVPDPTIVAEEADRIGADVQSRWPILLDPTHEVVEAAGIRSSGDVAVLDPGGMVLYRGDVDGLSDAIYYAARGRMPTVPESPPAGTSLPEPTPLVAPDATVTFAQDVAPILRAHCVECHRPGEVAPFSLLTYKDAAKRARFVAEVAGSRRMPPWKAEPGYGEFRDSHRLTRRELATLDRWAEAGAPEGDPGDLGPPPTFGDGWALGQPDLVLRMAGPYAVPASGDDFRGFVLPGPIVGDHAVAAIEFRPGNRKVVHHARVFIDETDYSKNLEASAPDPGFFYGGGADIPRPSLGEWNPGVRPRPPLDGVAKPVRSGASVVLLLHYHGSGKVEADRSSVGIYFARGPSRRIMAMHPLSSDRLDIPAGEPRHREVARSTLPHDVHAYSVLPHGHNLLREMKFTATLPDGRVVRLLWVKDWDLNWQGQYHFAEPVALPKGTKVEVVAFYDNSSGNPNNPNSPPRRMKYGPGTDAEMLGCHLYVVADDEAGDRHYRAQWSRGF